MRMQPTEGILGRCERAVLGASDWLAEQQAPDGTHAGQVDLRSYYKAPCCHAATGHLVQAAKYARLIKERYLQPDGDFRTRPDHKGWDELPSTPHNRYVYPNGWLVVGFQRMGRYDLAVPGISFIESMICEPLGGVWSGCEGGRPVREYLDSSSTASAGLALLACGKVAKARATGEFLLRLLDAQPQPERYYFSSWHVDDGLRTDVFGDDDVLALEGRKNFCLSAEHDAAGEFTWLVGKPMKFLAKVYEATGERRYLRAADRLLDFFQRLSEGRWTNYSSCKIMWAAAELWRHTGSGKYLDVCNRIADFICGTQLPWGGWLHTVLYEKECDQPLAVSLDITQEFCAELADVVADLSAGAPCEEGPEGGVRECSHA